MSSNRTFTCDYCKKRIEEWIESQYGKIPQKEYEKLKEISEVDEIMKVLPDDWKFGETDRLGGCDLDYDFVEDWGEGICVNQDGNLEIDVGCCCDMCGRDFSYCIILPPNNKTENIDLTKKDRSDK